MNFKGVGEKNDCTDLWVIKPTNQVLPSSGFRVLYCKWIKFGSNFWFWTGKICVFICVLETEVSILKRAYINDNEQETKTKRKYLKINLCSEVNIKVQSDFSVLFVWV